MFNHLKRQLIPWGLITLVNGYVLFNFIRKDSLLHGVGYFAFFYVSVLVIELIASRLSIITEIPIKLPRQELLITIGFTVLGILALVTNFYLRSTGKEYSFLLRLPIIACVFLFTFPVALAGYFLLRKYRLTELGLSIRPWKIILIGFAVWAVTGAFAYLFNREGILWARAYEEMGGIPGLILQGVIGAALAEEFFRFIWQTRLNVLTRNMLLSILCTSTVWAFIHFPVSYFNSRDFTSTLNYCIQIIPLGFIWGYMIHKTRSIVPSVIAHGLNLWGFQNG
jgi:membrane protease YdiL (CAAX protease family)